MLAVVEQEPCVSLIILGTSWRNRWDIALPVRSHLYHPSIFNDKEPSCIVLTCVCLFLDDHSGFQYLQFSSKHEDPEALVGSNQGSCCFCFLFFFAYVTHVPTSRTTFQTFFHVRCFPVSNIFCMLCPRAMSPNWAGFCCLTAGTIWAGLQNHQITVWEVSAVYGCTGPQKRGEQPGTLPSECGHRNNGNVNTRSIGSQAHPSQPAKQKKQLSQAFIVVSVTLMYNASHVVWSENNQIAGLLIQKWAMVVVSIRLPHYLKWNAYQKVCDLFNSNARQLYLYSTFQTRRQVKALYI